MILTINLLCNYTSRSYESKEVSKWLKSFEKSTYLMDNSGYKIK